MILIIVIISSSTISISIINIISISIVSILNDKYIFFKFISHSPLRYFKIVEGTLEKNNLCGCNNNCPVRGNCYMLRSGVANMTGWSMTMSLLSFNRSLA